MSFPGLPADMSRGEWREQRASKGASSPAPAAPSFLPSTPPADATDDTPLTILTVCTGNICRSPMAEVLLRARLEPLGIRVHSAGTHALVDHEMTEPAQTLAVASGARSADAAAHSAPEDDDVIDPYRRSQETYAKSAGQLIPAVDEVERMVRAALV